MYIKFKNKDQSHDINNWLLKEYIDNRNFESTPKAEQSPVNLPVSQHQSMSIDTSSSSSSDKATTLCPLFVKYSNIDTIQQKGDLQLPTQITETPKATRLTRFPLHMVPSNRAIQPIAWHIITVEST